MTERDFDKNPYSEGEKRVCQVLRELTGDVVGCGDDPIGFMISSWAYLTGLKDGHLKRIAELEADWLRAAQETTQLRVGVTKAIGLEWKSVCPDDEVIIAECGLLKDREAF